MSTFTLVLGAWIAVGFLGTLIGTAGWIGSMLIVFSATGDWPRGVPPPGAEKESGLIGFDQA
ncbi:MAG TPA: hypothetical protein VGI97_05070 [Gemmatimonadaceae bacterium]